MQNGKDSKNFVNNPYKLLTKIPYMCGPKAMAMRKNKGLVLKRK